MANEALEILLMPEGQEELTRSLTHENLLFLPRLLPPSSQFMLSGWQKSRGSESEWKEMMMMMMMIVRRGKVEIW